MNGGSTKITEFEIFRGGVESEELTIDDIYCWDDVDGFDNDEFINDLLKNIMEIAYERKLKVVPILPKIALFFRKNICYRDLLPPGIKI